MPQCFICQREDSVSWFLSSKIYLILSFVSFISNPTICSCPWGLQLTSNSVTPQICIGANRSSGSIPMYELLMFPPHRLCVNIYLYHWVSNPDNKSSFEWFTDVFSSPQWFCTCLPFTLSNVRFFLLPWDSDTKQHRECQNLSPTFNMFFLFSYILLHFFPFHPLSSFFPNPLKSFPHPEACLLPSPTP